MSITVAHTTRGCHESYLRAMHPNRYTRDLIPHLVSRIIYTGAGGFNAFSPGIVPTLSPRVHHLREEVADGSREQGAARHLAHQR